MAMSQRGIFDDKPLDFGGSLFSELTQAGWNSLISIKSVQTKLKNLESVQSHHESETASSISKNM
jgi:hypothetical protein